MKKLKFALLLALSFLAFPTITTYAADEATYVENAEDGYYSGSGSTNVYTGTFIRMGDQIQLKVKDKNGRVFYGMDAVTICNNFIYTDNLESLLLSCGVVGGIEQLNKLGFYKGGDGRWHGQNGKMGIIDLAPLLNPTPTSTTAPSTNSDYDSVWVLQSLDSSGGGTTFGSDGVVPYNGRTYAYQGGDTYKDNRSPEDMFNAPDASLNRSFSQVSWVSLNKSYTATWVEVRKVKIETPAPVTTTTSKSKTPAPTLPPIITYEYKLGDTTSQTVYAGWNADIYNPSYSSRLPIDLTTQAAYSGQISITNSAYANTVLAPYINSSVYLEVTKENFATGEQMKLLDTNYPMLFTVDFKDGWFGLNPAEFNLWGDQNYKSNFGVGTQWVAWAELVYGGEYLQELRGKNKVVSMTALGNTSQEIIATNKELTTSATSIKQGTYDFYLRSIMTSGDVPYQLGFNGNNAWITYFQMCVNNARGISWGYSVNSTPNSLTSWSSPHNNPYVIYTYFEQPILHGEFTVETVGGNR